MTAGSAGRRFPTYRLALLLAAMTIGVAVVRTALVTQMVSEMGVRAPWRPILASQIGYWVSWAIAAIALTPVIERFLRRPRGVLLTLAATVAVLVAILVIVPWMYAPVHWVAYGRMFSFGHAYAHQAGHDALLNVVLALVTVSGIAGAINLRRRRESDLAASRLGEQLTAAKLEALRAQLNPHFLFNVLNSIAVLARRGDNTGAERMTSRLADLLRASLDEAPGQIVPLSVELDLVRRYLDIEEVRFRDRLDVHIDVPASLHSAAVPSLLLQPVVENAIRHGFSGANGACRISIVATRANGVLELVVRDDGSGLNADDEMPEGIGLGNTRARLTALYGGSGTLTISAAPGDRGTEVRIRIPQTAAQQADARV